MVIFCPSKTEVWWVLAKALHSHVKVYGDVPPKCLSFSQRNLRNGSHFGQIILRQGFHSSFEKKKVKSAIFEAEKPLEMGPDLKKFQKKGKKKKKKPVKSANFWVRTILRCSFRPRAAHPVKKLQGPPVLWFLLNLTKTIAFNSQTCGKFLKYMYAM